MGKAGRLGIMADSEPERFFERRYGLLLVGILVLGLGCRIATYFDLVATDPGFFHPALDSRNFLQWAGRIAAGEFGLDRPFFLNPLYPYFLAPIRLVSGGSELTELAVIRVVQTLLGLLTILTLAAATRRFFDRKVALLAALFAATYPLLTYYEQHVMIVTLAVFLNTLTLWLLARFMDRRTVGAALLAGIPLGLSVLARPNVVLFALLLPLWMWWLVPAGRRIRFVVSRTALLYLGIVVMVLPCTIHNWIVSKDFVPVTSSMGMNVYQSNNPWAWEIGWMASRELRLNPTLVENDSVLIAEREMGRELKASEVSDYWVKRSLLVMAENPREAIGFLVRKFLYFFRSAEIPSSYDYSIDRKKSSYLGYVPLSFGVISPLMLLGGIAVLRRGRRRATPLVFLLIAYAVGLTIFFPLAHYRAPVLPAALPLAALGIVVVVAPLRERRWRDFALRAGVLAILILFTKTTEIAKAMGYSKFAGLDSDQVVYHYNQGIFHLGRAQEARSHGDRENADFHYHEARKALELGRDTDDRSCLPHIGLAALAYYRDEPALEAMHLEDALDRKPDAWEAMANLGRNYARRGRVEEGLDLGRRAARNAPRDESVLGALALTLYDLGRWEDAVEAYARAIAGAQHPVPGMVADRSYCLRQLRRHDEAWAEVTRALAITPGAPELLIEAAWISIETENRSAAEIRADIDRAAAAGGFISDELEQWKQENDR